MGNRYRFRLTASGAGGYTLRDAYVTDAASGQNLASLTTNLGAANYFKCGEFGGASSNYTKLEVYLRAKVGAPTFDFTIGLYALGANVAGTLLASTANINASTITADGWYSGTISSTAVTLDTIYFIGLYTATGGDTSNYLIWANATEAPGYPGYNYFDYATVGPTWVGNSNSPKMFRTYSTP